MNPAAWWLALGGGGALGVGLAGSIGLLNPELALRDLAVVAVYLTALS